MVDQKSNNPFEHDAASNLSENLILEYFIEDHNYTRFINSNRNIFLLGDRGSGKSMTLLYHSLKIKKLQSEKKNIEFPLDFIGVYIPCNTPLIHKREHKLLDDKYLASVLSEHLFSLTIAYWIVSTVSEIPLNITSAKEVSLRNELEYILGEKLPEAETSILSLKKYLDSESIKSQRQFLLPSNDFFDAPWSFSTLVMPIIEILKSIPLLMSSHFMLMIDDAHDLNFYQRQILNSWVAYREHSLFSFKIASAKSSNFTFETSSGGSILEGHDYIKIDLEQPFQNKRSSFSKLANDIIQRRLNKFGIKATPDNFFPTNESMVKNLLEHESLTRAEAIKRYGEDNPKTISDYVYKFSRVSYFRSRSPKANLPPYSGFETLVHLSTGVIRNLLDPCYWMYDHIYSELKEGDSVLEIPPNIQSEIIIQKSKDLWEKLENGLDKYISDCTSVQAEKIFKLFDNLAVLFRDRLATHKSEPRAICFTISGMTKEHKEQIVPLLEIARRAQLLYLRTGTAKDDGKLEQYYVPNRMLWPSRGLDPIGQHARVSLKSTDIIEAANGKKFPYSLQPADTLQKGLFDV